MNIYVPFHFFKVSFAFASLLKAAFCKAKAHRGTPQEEISRRTDEGLKLARSLARSNYFCSAGFRKSVVYLSNMAELIVNIHDTVTCYIANAPDKNLATKIGDELLKLSRAVVKHHTFPEQQR